MNFISVAFDLINPRSFPGEKESILSFSMPEFCIPAKLIRLLKLLWDVKLWTTSISRVYKIKVLRRIYGTFRIGIGEYNTRWNDELCEICGDIDQVQQTNAPVLKVFVVVFVVGRGKPRYHWLTQEQNDMASFEISNWR